MQVGTWWFPLRPAVLKLLLQLLLNLGNKSVSRYSSSVHRKAISPILGREYLSNVSPSRAARYLKEWKKLWQCSCQLVSFGNCIKVLRDRGDEE